ncbi:MAG: polysaccharide deacetylase family protein [Firmicutes bacterium]|nr:polysaccharide deacetylase family protein [Bacillota bacterium]
MGVTGRRWRITRLVIGLLLLVLAAALIYYRFDPAYRYFNGVKAGVHFRGENLGGLLAEEVALVVAEVAREEGREPVNAIVEPETGALVPELNGIEVDRQLTVEAILAAPRDSTVEPVYRQTVPARRSEDYPSLLIYKGNSRKPAVGLMINVAWNRDDSLQPMLALLEAEGAQGTFFLTGRWVEEHRDLARKIDAGGHELASHGYSDLEVFPDLTAEEMESSLRQTNEIIFEICGRYPRYFTPHKGEYNPLTLEVVSRHDMRLLLWSLDTIDWSSPGVEAMQERIMAGLHPGAIILMHPTGDTVEFLARVLPLIAEQGLQVVAMSELLGPGPITY